MKVLVVGGGLIGLGIAWRAALLGLKVVVVDAPTPRAASFVAAGLLIPAGGRISRHHLSLRQASVQLYPETIAALEESSGLSCGYNPCGTLTVAFEPGAQDSVEGLANCLRGMGIEVESLDARECLKREPHLSEEVACGFYTADHQVDPVKLVAALRKSCELLGVEFLEGRVVSVGAKELKLQSGEILQGDKVVVAAGAWMAELLQLAVFPVKGEVIQVRAPRLRLSHNLVLRREDLYVANRGDGTLVIGASEEEKGFDETVTATLSLKQKADRLLPKLGSAEVLETRVGFRPKLGDGLPLLGDFRGLTIAGAHYRNGVLLMPVTAKLISEYLVTGLEDDLMLPFGPQRDTRHRSEKAG